MGPFSVFQAKGPLVGGQSRENFSLYTIIHTQLGLQYCVGLWIEPCIMSAVVSWPLLGMLTSPSAVTPVASEVKGMSESFAQ